jgi:cysteinyl-tRNA synthetase
MPSVLPVIRIHNSLTRRKEPLAPILPGKVRMYVCGMTVYDYCHIGHARVMVVFDMVARYLRARGYDLTYVRNVTDIDDKIIKRAAENGEPVEALTARFIQFMHEDERALGVLPPDEEPRATTHIPEIVAMIARLIANGYAYQGVNGDVYYRVRKFAPYGRLSGKSLDELQVGARIAADESKDDPLDFVLWKSAKPGEPQWDSPWGPGRPGWHIECSAMSTRCLGDHFDIHGGGLDLQFPHHENEIAQSEGATGQPFVNLWMHNGFVRVADEKMSKSLGNFFTIREVLAKFDPETVRYLILASHYRSPLNYSDDSLDNAKQALTRLYLTLQEAGIGEAATVPSLARGPHLDPIGAPDASGETFVRRFYEAMDDDFNSPIALAVLFDLAREINRARESDPAEARALAGRLRELGGILGLLERDPAQFLKGQSSSAAGDAEIEALVAARTAARASRNWAESDRIRDELRQRGVILEDKAGVTTWRRE